MNILVIGSGAREHAIVAALHRSPKHPVVFCCGPTLNPGINAMAQDYWLGNITDAASISTVAKKWQIDLAIIGPEAPLAHGLADALWEVDIPVVGPKKKLAQIETSKIFARDLMTKHAISGLPRYRRCTQLADAESFLHELGEHHFVIKADGLMGGKGVKVAGDHLSSIAEALQFCEEIFASKQSVIIEEKLIGQEFSLMCFCDGEKMVPMPIVQDHKRAFIDDKGPNTGGMGSYSDANHSLPFLTPEDAAAALAIMEKTMHALAQECQDQYVGILYGSFIITQQGVFVIEFNARFGDPEALNVLAILQSDLVTICEALVSKKLSAALVQFAALATVCKYAVPQGYPDAPIKDVAIDIGAVKNKSYLYLASVDMVNGQIIMKGSRTAAYVGVAPSIYAAEMISEKEVRGIAGPLYHREDIGTSQLIQKRMDEIARLRSE